MRIVVRKWGNSASIRIPAAIMEAAKLSVDQTVDVREEGGRVIIEPIHEEILRIEDLVAGITDENQHEFVDMGPPVGNEVW
jgi:antitoxin MazE